MARAGVRAGRRETEKNARTIDAGRRRFRLAKSKRFSSRRDSPPSTYRQGLSAMTNCQQAQLENIY
jgi:hypothetical protein